MLKNVPSIISPDLMRVMMQMGHGDELVLADGNFPADSNTSRLVRADGLGVTEVLEAVLKFFPMDTFVEDPATVMAPVDKNAPEPPIWKDFRRLLEMGEGRRIELAAIDRFKFYERSRAAYAIVATGETALYANIILKKGVVT